MTEKEQSALPGAPSEESNGAQGAAADAIEAKTIEKQPIFRFPPNMSLLRRQAYEAFSRDLESLLQEYDSDYWVVYQGSKRLAVSLSLDELYAEMARRSIPHDELFYHRLYPIVTRAYLV